MPELELRAMYSFRSQPWEAAKAALASLVVAKDKLLPKNIPGVDTLLARVQLIYDTAVATEGSEDTLRRIEQETIRFLDCTMVDLFLANPENKTVRDELIAEILFIAAATGNEPELWDVEPYTIEEFKAVLAGNSEIYEDTIFVHTLRSMLVSAGSREYADALFYSLPAANGAPNKAEFRWWDDAFVFACMLQALWDQFHFLDFAEQQFCIQNYLYQSVVLGVPVRSRFVEILKAVPSQEQFEILSNFFYTAIAQSRETIPVNVENWTEERLADVLERAIKLSINNDLGALAQDKFVKDLYANQEDTDMLAVWLREVLGIATHLKKHDLQ